jgi:hypothetical protein
MAVLAVAPPRIAVLSFDLRCATPVPSILIGRSGSSPLQSLPNQAFNAPWQHTASTAIPIASDAPPRPVSRGFLPWRFADAGPGARGTSFMGPASENLHMCGRLRVGKSFLHVCSVGRCSHVFGAALEPPRFISRMLTGRRTSVRRQAWSWYRACTRMALRAW